MPKEYIRGESFPVISDDPRCGQSDESNDAKITWDREENGGTVQMAIFRNNGSYQSEHEDPQYMTLDRSAINRMIRVLRRARDQAYGRDE